jgi:hypothetical protein
MSDQTVVALCGGFLLGWWMCARGIDHDLSSKQKRELIDRWQYELALEDAQKARTAARARDRAKELR